MKKVLGDFFGLLIMAAVSFSWCTGVQLIFTRNPSWLISSSGALFLTAAFLLNLKLNGQRPLPNGPRRQTLLFGTIMFGVLMPVYAGFNFFVHKKPDWDGSFMIVLGISVGLVSWTLYVRKVERSKSQTGESPGSEQTAAD